MPQITIHCPGRETRKFSSEHSPVQVGHNGGIARLTATDQYRPAEPRNIAQNPAKLTMANHSDHTISSKTQAISVIVRSEKKSTNHPAIQPQALLSPRPGERLMRNPQVPRFRHSCASRNPVLTRYGDWIPGQAGNDGKGSYASVSGEGDVSKGQREAPLCLRHLPPLCGGRVVPALWSFLDRRRERTLAVGDPRISAPVVDLILVTLHRVVVGGLHDPATMAVDH